MKIKSLVMILVLMIPLLFLPIETQKYPDTVKAQAKKMVLIEMFTATWCPPCAMANPAIDEMYESGGNEQFMMIKYHVSDSFETTFSRTRSTKYKANAIPTMVVDGKDKMVGFVENFKGEMQQKIDTAGKVETNIQIDATPKWVSSDQIEYSVTWSGDFQSKKAYAVIMQDYTYYFGPNGEKIHRFLVRDGKTIESLQNNSDKFTFTIDPDWSTEMLVGAVWIEDDKGILQSQLVKIAQIPQNPEKPVFSSSPNKINFEFLSPQTMGKKFLVLVNAGKEKGEMEVSAKDAFIKIASNDQKLMIDPLSQKKISIEIDTKNLNLGIHESEIYLKAEGYQKTIPVTFEVVQAPEIVVSQSMFNFGRCTKDSISVQKLTISNKSAGPIKGRIKPSVKWINLSSTLLDDHEKTIEISIDASKMKPGLYKETIEIETTGGNATILVRLDLVEKKVEIKLTLDNLIPVIDGVPQEPLESAPFIMAGRTMVPLRFISMAMGAKIEYDAKDRKIKITYQDIKIDLQVGNPQALINQREATIDAPPVIRFGRTFVPLRFITQAFGAEITYKAETRTVTIIF
jgi:thiol-disulfide isomerase/thioredoxin